MNWFLVDFLLENAIRDTLIQLDVTDLTHVAAIMISNYENKIKHPALQNTDTKNNTAMLNAKIIAAFLEGLR